MYHTTLDPRQHATVLAALRYWQSNRGLGNDPDIDIIANNDHTVVPLNTDEIDELCEQIQEAETQPYVVCSGNPFDGMTLIGPFGDVDAAQLYAERRKLDEFWINELEAREK